MNKSLSGLIFALFVGLIGLATPVQAVEFRQGDTVNIAKDQVTNGSLFVGGSSITIDGVIDGDVYCGGQQITITGIVQGDVICAGQTMRVTGNVQGSVRFAGQTLDVDGQVSRNVVVLGQTVNMSPDATVSGEVLFGAQTLSMAGTIGKSLTGGGQNVVLDGSVAGDTSLEAEHLTMGTNARLSGALSYRSSTDATMMEGASVSGSVVRTTPAPQQEERGKGENRVTVKQKAPWPVSAIGGIIIHILLGLLVVTLAPAFTGKVAKELMANPVMTGLKGALVLMATPVVCVILMVTIIGIPAGILGFLLYGFVIWISRIFVATVVGHRVLEMFWAKHRERLTLQILAGVPVLWLLLKAPFVGGLISFVAVIWGMGAIAGALKTKKH